MTLLTQLSANEQSVPEGVFRSHGPARDALSSRLEFSKTRANQSVYQRGRGRVLAA